MRAQKHGAGARAFCSLQRQFRVSAAALDQLINRAVGVGRNGREIGGLILDNGHHLELIELKNKIKNRPSFAFYYEDVRAVVKATRLLGYEVVGSFHSHPYSLATPGETDIRYAVDDSLMLVINCTERIAHLWHVRNGKANRLRFSRLRDCR